MRVRTLILLLVGICLLSATLYFLERSPTVETLPVQIKVLAGKPGAGEWVASDNRDLSLRLRVKSTGIAVKDSIFVIAEIRNDRKAPLTILRPFGDPFLALGGQIKIWGQGAQIEYTGPIADYDLDAKAFVTLEVDEAVTATLELPVQYFAGTDKAGAYVVRYDYAYSGTWDKKVATEGVTQIWHGSVTSREVPLQKK